MFGAHGTIMTPSPDHGDFIPPPSEPMSELSDKDFSKFCQLIYQHAGIYLSPQKKELVRARLSKIIRSRGLAGFSEYYELVRQDRSGQELVQLLDAISTNQTSFWREPAHFIFLGEELLPAWRRQGRGGRRWRLWSAGCSSGEEPYTLAMVLLETLTPQELTGVKILATDLSTKVLSQAQQGIYPLAKLEPLPVEWRKRFFQRGVNRWEGYARVKPEVKALVHFARLNLMEPFRFRENFDIIFCRNVMIYFDKATQAELVNKFHQCLNPGGYLFIGHSESLCNISHHFTYVKPTIYRK